MNEAFDHHYSKIYGERWPQLKAALKTNHQVAFEPGFPQRPIADMKPHQAGEAPERLENGLLREYFLDPASVLVARSLPVETADKVLDMCAAPGGKSLVLYSRLSPSAEIICNETSKPRREALTKVLQNYISRDGRNRVWVRGLDGAQYGLRHREEFDAILVDAPCSGESHLLENPREMANWSPRRTQGLAIKQYSLLSSAWSAIRPGGFILYSTCTISPEENDGVIAKLLKKKKTNVRIVKPKLEIDPEWTEFGFQYFPDQYSFGPLYGCLLQKIGANC